MHYHRKSKQVVSLEVAGCLQLTLAAAPFKAAIQHDGMVVLPCMLCKGRLFQCPLLTCILVLLHPRLDQPPHCLPNVLLATAAGGLLYHLGPLLHPQGVLHPGWHGAEGQSRPEDNLQAELPADPPDVLTDSFHVGKHHQWGSASRHRCRLKLVFENYPF